MIGGVILDQGDVGVAGLLEVGVGRGQPDVGIAGSLDVVRHQPDVGVAGELAAGLHADDHGARAGHRVGRHREIVEQDVVVGAGVRGRACSAAGRLQGREVHRLVRQVGLGRAELELGEVEVFEVLVAAGGGDFQVREPQLGVAAQAAAAGQFVDVHDPEPPGAAIEERADLAVLRLALELLGSSCPGRGLLLPECKIEPWRWSSRSRSADGGRGWVDSRRAGDRDVASRQASGLRIIESSAEPAIDHRLDGGRLRRLVVIVLQLQVPLILTGCFELDRTLGIGGIDTVDGESPALVSIR